MEAHDKLLYTGLVSKQKSLQGDMKIFSSLTRALMMFCLSTHGQFPALDIDTLQGPSPKIPIQKKHKIRRTLGTRNPEALFWAKALEAQDNTLTGSSRNPQGP